MTRYIKRGGQVWIKIFPDKPVTAKPAETRMGSGKGALEYWVAVVKPGDVYKRQSTSNAKNSFATSCSSTKWCRCFFPPKRERAIVRSFHDEIL